MKKIIISLFLATTLSVNTSFAVLPVIDGANLGIQTFMKGLEIAANNLFSAANIKEYALDPLAYAIKERVKTQLKQEIVKWATDGGTGKPQFLENPDRFFTNLATQELTIIKRDIIGNIVGNDEVLKALVSGNAEGYAKKSLAEFLVPTVNVKIQNNICAADKLAKMTAENPTGAAEFKRRYCIAGNSTSSKQQQYDALQNCFAKDFSCGGWDAFLSMTQKPYQNTETGRLTVAQLQLQQNQAAATTKTNNELNRGGGFFSQKVCKKGALKITNDDEGNPLPESSQICTEYETLTPGDQIRNLTNEVLGDPLKQLQQSDEISEIIVSALLTKLQSVGLRKLNEVVADGINGLSNALRGGSDGAGNLRDSVAATGKPGDPRVASTSVTITDADHRNLTATMLQMMNNTLKEHNTNITVVVDELNRYQALADKLAQIELCYSGKAWLTMPTVVRDTIDSQKQNIAAKTLSLANELSVYKGKSDDLVAAIETVTRSRDADAITNIFNAYNAELSSNSYLTSAVADKRKLDNETLYAQLDQLSTTFDSMLTECQNATQETGGGN
jgi:hypothetical protein